MFGRYQLLRLLGKSERTMAWLVMDARTQQEGVLVLPRVQPQGEALESWRMLVNKAARLRHPALARAVEIGEQDRWPYVAYDRGDQVTWAERFSRQGIPPAELAPWAAQVAQGLAFAHEAGVAHHDLQPWMLTVDGNHRVTVMGLEVPGRTQPLSQSGAMDELRAVRLAGEADVLALGLVMYQGLVGQPPLDEPDVGLVMGRMPPRGPEIVRLPWAVPRPVPEPLRAIVNRATDRQERQRYRNARTLQRALEGWLKTLSEKDGGPLALVLDRLRSVGVLPSLPGGAERVARLALMDRCRTNELAEVVLGDMALTFELLRMVNIAQAHGSRVSGDGPVLMVRRAIAMLGLEGVRQAALSLRTWPGPMNETAARDMDVLVRRVQRAAELAVLLAPAGYDGEVIRLIAMLQNLGRLVVQYHFPEEASQIRRLMLPDEGGHGDPGMSAEAASFAVLGLDIDDLGVAVATHWGLDESVQSMMRRPAPGALVRNPENDAESLRLASACANELLDALMQPAARVQSALKAVVQRYARPLNLGLKDFQEALVTSANPHAVNSPVTPHSDGRGFSGSAVAGPVPS